MKRQLFVPPDQVAVTILPKNHTMFCLFLILFFFQICKRKDLWQNILFILQSQKLEWMRSFTTCPAFNHIVIGKRGWRSCIYVTVSKMVSREVERSSSEFKQVQQCYFFQEEPSLIKCTKQKELLYSEGYCSLENFQLIICQDWKICT